jgi:hypothetical protein
MTPVAADLPDPAPAFALRDRLLGWLPLCTSVTARARRYAGVNQSANAAAGERV